MGNIRSTVASAVTQVVNPGVQQYAAGYEPENEATETAMFDKVSELRADKPGSLSASDQKAALLQDNQRLGTSIMLKVMAGDKVDINAENFYESLQSSNNNNEAAAGQLFEQVIGSLAGGSAALNSAEGSSANALTERILSKPEAITAYEDLLAAETDSTRPKAFLNFLFFDEELNLVPEHSRIWQADGENSWSRIGSEAYTALEMPQNGYIVSYLSNQSAQEAWFDNLSVDVSPGILLEEQHYYAYGLPIAGLGSLAATATRSRQRYQGNEYIEERGLDWMDFHNRQYDPQLGRFLSLDPLADAGGQQVLSPYHAMGCNPVTMVDPLGLRAGMFPETHGAGGPTQMDIALMIPPTILQEMKQYNFNPSKSTDAIAERMVSAALGMYLHSAFKAWGLSYNSAGFRDGRVQINYTYVVPTGVVSTYEGTEEGGTGLEVFDVINSNFTVNFSKFFKSNEEKRIGIAANALTYLRAQSNGSIYNESSDYMGLEGASKCNIFVYDMLMKEGINIGKPNQQRLGWKYLFEEIETPPTSKQWADPNYDIPGFSFVSTPQIGDVVIIRGTNVGHVGIMVSDTESVYTNGHEIIRSNFGSDSIWTTGKKNYWPGHNGFVYRRYNPNNK